MILDKILLQAKGVIHVGAHIGQERDDYAAHDLNVMWIEPIPVLFNMLRTNLLGYPKQIAFQYLITDRNGDIYVFHISDSGGGPSSIFEWGPVGKAVWPHVNYIDSLKIESRTLDSIPTDGYDALVLDVQGSELVVLKGAVE